MTKNIPLHWDVTLCALAEVHQHSSKKLVNLYYDTGQGSTSKKTVMLHFLQFIPLSVYNATVKLTNRRKTRKKERKNKAEASKKLGIYITELHRVDKRNGFLAYAPSHA